MFKGAFTHWSNIKGGHGCPTCNYQISFKEIELFKLIKFNYPDALSNNSGPLKNRRFKFDIYISSLKIAIEYDGYRWHDSDWAIKRGQKKRDKRKDLLANEVGVRVIRIKEKDYIKDPIGVQESLLDLLLQ